MNSFLLKRISVSVLSIALALALITITYSTIVVGIFQNEHKIEKEINKYSAELIESIDEAVAPAAKNFNLDKSVLQGAITEENISVISKEVATNFINAYTTDLSENTRLFNAYMSALTDYAEQNGKNMSEKKKVEIASYAVDAVANRLYSSETASVPIFRYAKNTMMMYLIVGAVVIIVFSVVIIDMFTRGRHRKFSFIGMGIISAGYVELGLPLYIRMRGKLQALRLVSFVPYNKALIACFNDLLLYSMIVGAVLFIAGLVMLIVNYAYFWRKNAMIKASREVSEDIMNDYMEVEESVGYPRQPSGEFDKEIMSIDFDE